VGILRIRRKATEYSNGLMAECTRVNGKMVNNTVREYLSIKKEIKWKQNGRKEKE
jgi:hypothetical protein